MSEKRKRVESPEKDREEGEEEERVARYIKPIPASKLQAFTIGSQKKSAFQKHKEEVDLKKQVNLKKESPENLSPEQLINALH